jgi:hypothetical protein
MLCKFCAGISFKSIRGSNYKHQPSLEALKKSGANGCELCDILHHDLTKYTWSASAFRSKSDTRVWLEDFNVTEEHDKKYSSERDTLKVYCGPVGDSDSPTIRIQFSASEGSKSF